MKLRSTQGRKLTPILLLVMLFAWLGHPFTLAVVVHSAEPLSVASEHSHGEQSLHQLASISHQHGSQAPDHQHDTPKLIDDRGQQLVFNRRTQLVDGAPPLPVPPRFRIERPPRPLA